MQKQKLRCPQCGYMASGLGEYCPMDGSRLLEDQDPLIGQTLEGWYQILDKIAEGGMGAIYKARLLHVIDQIVAIKVIRPEYAREPDYRRRFYREASTLIRSRHRHIVAGYDLHETTSGQLFLVMEFLRGETVHQAVVRSPTHSLPLGTAMQIMGQAVDAVEHAHRLNIIHRDIKPANLFLVEEDGDPFFVKVLDFGLARPLDQPAITIPNKGMVGGTIGYLAPEAYEGEDYLTPALDVYALGCTFVEMLTGRPALEGADHIAVIQAHRKRLPPRLQELRPDLEFPRELEDLVRGMLMKKRDQRLTLPAIREQIARLESKLPTRAGQSLLVASTVFLFRPEDRVQGQSHDTEPTKNVNLQQIAGLIQQLEKTESERENALAAATVPLYQLLQTRPRPEWPSDVGLLESQSRHLKGEEESVQQTLSQALVKRDRERQRNEDRRAELHLLIRKLREDIRARPPANLGERLNDEQTLEHLEKQFFSLQVDPALTEQLAKATVEHQRIKHLSSVAVHRLGQAVMVRWNEYGPRSARWIEIRTALSALERSLDLLGRCNHNAEALMEDLPVLHRSSS